jgi:hypothetical protein
MELLHNEKKIFLKYLTKNILTYYTYIHDLLKQ